MPNTRTPSAFVIGKRTTRQHRAWTTASIGVLAIVLVGCATTDRTLEADAVASGAARVRVTWRTETETNAFGFYVYRSESLDAPPTCLNADNPLHAVGTTTLPQQYVYYDLDVSLGKTYYYKLEQVDLDGGREWVAGHPKPYDGVAKALTEEEAKQIQTRGPMFRDEAV